MATYAFSGASAEVRDYGQRSKFRFGGTWAVGDTWTAAVTSTLSGNFTFGKGNISDKTITSVFKFRNRAILGFNGGFALSAIDDPTGWEEQNVGSAVIPFTTQYGNGDSAYGFASIGNRFAVFGEKTTQIWTIDADPSKWVLSQVLDNTGTKHGDGIQAIGEVDVFYPDRTGIRSLRSKELSGDAFVSDVGTPIDSIVRSQMLAIESTEYPICSIIDPITKNYWVFINDTIYVLSQSPMSKITAWSTFAPLENNDSSSVAANDATFVGGVTTYTVLEGFSYHWVKGSVATRLVNGTETLLKSGSFTASSTTVTVYGTSGESTGGSLLYRNDIDFRPTKFWTVNGSIYCLSSDRVLYKYEPNSMDWSNAVIETPWLDFGSPSKRKQFQAIDIAAVGSWRVSISTNPQTGSFVQVMQKDPITSPSLLAGSSYDLSRFAFSGNGTHIKLRLECDDKGAGVIAPKLSAVNIIYNVGNEK